ncbi:MAG: hypothetical protein ACK5O7_06405 [Holosporales bacterium]
MQITDHFQTIAKDFHSFIIEVDGIIQKDQEISPEALLCLEHLATAGKRVTLISNRACRTHDFVRQLQRLGVSAGDYQLAITSGEEAYQHLFRRKDPWHAQLGHAVYMVGDTLDRHFIDDLDLRPVHNLEEADFILTLENIKEGAYSKEWLYEALHLGLPLVAANPNEVHCEKNRIYPTAGSVAATYTSLGGACFFHGLPYPRILQSALKFLSPDTPQQVMVVTGSRLETLETCHALDLRTTLVPTPCLLHRLDETSDLNDVSQHTIIEKIYKSSRIPDAFLSAFRW